MTALGTRDPRTGRGRRAGWTPARVVSAVIGALLALGSLGLPGAGGVALWASSTQRHGGDIDLGRSPCASASPRRCHRCPRSLLPCWAAASSS